MQIHVDSKHLVADVAVALDPAGHEHMVVVAKATWNIPAPGQRPRPLKPQPLVMADEFYGEPGESALRYGSDFARFKARCDVIFNASAHVAGGKPVKQMDVAVQVGAMKKQVRVSGSRRWFRLLGISTLSPSEPFVCMPLHYGFAYGGSRWFDKGADRLCEAHLPNPVGLGFAGRKTVSQIDNEPAPCLEDPSKPVKSPDGQYQPHALSAVARHWSPRRELAGTYDQQWREEVFPLLPGDFDEAHHQVAPKDQQIDYPKGGELVVLRGVLPQCPSLSFTLPLYPLFAHAKYVDDSLVSEPMKVDTLYFDTEAGTMNAVWRASMPLRRRLQDFKAVAVSGKDQRAWHAQQARASCAGCSSSAAPSPLELA